MKIVQIIPSLASGGAERFVVDLSNELSKEHQVYLISFYDDEVSNFYKKELSRSINHIIVKKSKGFSIGLFLKLTRLLYAIRPNVIHLHLNAINYLLPFLLCSRFAKCFMTIHNDAYAEAGGLFGKLLRLFAFKSNLVRPVTISKQSLLSFRQCYKLDAPVVFNGRFIQKPIVVSEQVREEFLNYKKTPKTRILVNLARFSFVKRQPLIAKCVKRLCEEGYDFSFLMIGQNRQNEVLNQVEQFSCSSLFVLGEKSNPLQYLVLSDAYCLFSSFEGLPISLIEALATSTVPVCTPVGGIVDIVSHYKNGLLTKDLSEDEVYNSLKEIILMDDCQLNLLKNNAFECFDKYSIEETAKQYVKLFKLVK